MTKQNRKTDWQETCLGDEGLFSLENGTWTGKKAPLRECAVVRNTNFTNEGRLDLSDVAVIPIEERQIQKKRLLPGDIIVERSGGGPTQPVGRVVIFNGANNDYCFSNFTSRVRVENRNSVDPNFLLYCLLHFHMSGRTEALQRRTTGIRNLAWDDYKKSLLPLPPLAEQRAIAKALQVVQAAKDTRRRELTLERERKAALMDHLFVYGTGSEDRVQTPAGNIPRSWSIKRFDEFVVLQRGQDLPRDQFRPGNIPVIGATSILGYHDVSNVKGPGVTVVRSGSSAGIPLYVEQDFWAHNVVLYVKEFHGNHPKFAYYRLLTLRLDQFRSGVAVPTLNRNIFAAMPVGVPQLKEQLEIAGALDASQRLIDGLDAEAKALDELFRSMLEELISGHLSSVPLIVMGKTK